MDSGSSSETLENGTRQKGIKKNQDSLSPKLDPFVPRKDHNPRELRSWAKRTGFVSNFSGDVLSTVNERERESVQSGRDDTTEFDLESGEIDSEEKTSPKIEIDPIFGRARTNNRGIEIEPASRSRPVRSILEDDGESSLREVTGRNENERSFGAEPVFGVKENERKVQSNANVNGNGNLREEAGVSPVLSPRMEQKKDEGIEKREREVDIYPGGGGEPGPGGWRISPRMNFYHSIFFHPILFIGHKQVPLIYYGIQHYLSLAGSLIFIPVIVVPAMGGSDKDTATVISTMLLVSGITTILHSYFGTRLPLVQGSSFVFLAPALVILNSREYRNLSENKFRHIMRELQGAIIVGSIFQCLLGFSGFMSLLLRFVNPVVVSPTVAAIGLAFFSFGFPQAGSCVEISIPLILLVLIFTLYLRGVSIFGLRVFRIYAVPLSVILIWAYAFFLTAGGAYNYKGCSSAVPASNILVDSCRRHAYTMKHCRTDVSNAWKAAAWVGVPYPFQWGIPIFHFRTSLIMVIASLVASVDSIGTYHSSALRVHSKPPAPGIVSRGIGMEGFCSLLAGLWGTGTGSTTLTENVHTINVTKVASRRAVQLGAILLIFFSFIGKVGAIVASIPQALAASVLCFMWALVVALGLSTLQYSQTASFRNITIVGVSLFLGLSIPAYVQQYQPETSLILPSYFVPYAAASDGPVNTGSKDLDFALNGLLSMNMVVTLLVAFVLDNTVPGSRQERGVYIWSSAEDLTTNPSIHADYSLPARVTHCFRWASSHDQQPSAVGSL
ncbi:Nucleobase cation symporter 2 family, partial [Dillenia turbinata]